MSTLRNWVTNPSAELGTGGFWAARGTYVADANAARRLPGSYGNNVVAWTSDGTAQKVESWTAIVVPGDAPVTPGQYVRTGVRAWGDSQIRGRAGVAFYDADRKAIAYNLPYGSELSYADETDLTHLQRVPENAVFARARFEITPTQAWPAGNTKQVWADGFYMLVGDSPDDLPAGYIDGSLPTAGGHSYGWDGKPHASTSYRLDTIDLVNPWTRSWWDTLPNAYKEADANTNLELGGFPLLRWMNGIGQLGGEMRQISDDLWAGKYTDPATVPDSALRWLAMMLGLSAQHRSQSDEVLRERLTTLTNVGRSAAGTRAMIAESAKAFMVPGSQVRVEPSSKRPHVLIMYVRAYEVPNDDIETLARKVNAAGFVPAGHLVECQRVVTTWDAWEETAGATWADKERNIKTWNESDSAGVVLE